MHSRKSWYKTTKKKLGYFMNLKFSTVHYRIPFNVETLCVLMCDGKLTKVNIDIDNVARYVTNYKKKPPNELVSLNDEQFQPKPPPTPSPTKRTKRTTPAKKTPDEEPKEEENQDSRKLPQDEEIIEINDDDSITPAKITPTDDESEMIKTIKNLDLSDENLKTPPIVFNPKEAQNSKLDFLKRIIDYCTMTDLGIKLGNMASDRLRAISTEEVNLMEIRNKLKKCQIDCELEKINKEYEKELTKPPSDD